MATRTVRGTVQGLDNTEGSRVSFRILTLTASGTGVRYPSSTDAQTDENGNIEVDLLTNQTYQAVFPDGSEATFYLDDDTGDADLDALIFEATAQTPAQTKMFDAYIQARLPDLIQPHIAAAAANIAKGAAGVSFLSEPRNPSNSDGNDGDTWANLETGVTFKKASGAWAATGSIIGPPGPQGQSGAPGTEGPPGLSVYSHVRYAEDETGAGFSAEPTETATHLAVLMTNEPGDPPEEAFAGRFVRFRGFDGEDGDGREGPPGQDAYLHVRYAENELGQGATATPEVTSTHFAFLPSNDPELPEASEFEGRWVRYRAEEGTAPGTGYTPLPPLYIKLSDVSGGTLNISMGANREHVIELNAAKSIAFTNRALGGKAVLTFVVPTAGTIFPVAWAAGSAPTPAEADDAPTYSARRGYADTYLYRTYSDAPTAPVFSRASILDFPYTAASQKFWVDNAKVVYLFGNKPDGTSGHLLNSAEGRNHLTVNQGTNRTPYGIDIADNIGHAYSGNWEGFDWAGAWMVHLIFADLASYANDAAFAGFSSRTVSGQYIRIHKLVDSGGAVRAKMDARVDTLGGPIGGLATLLLPNNPTGLVSLLASHDGAGRFNLRCLNNGEMLKGATTDPAGYYPDNVAASYRPLDALGATFGGIYRTAPTNSIYRVPSKPRYLMAKQVGYSDAEAKASHNFAADYIAAVDPQGPQLARL